MVMNMQTSWWEGLTSAEQAFWGIAIIFSILFIIQFILSLIGLDFDAETDFEISTDLDTDTDGSLDADFSLFSVRSIIAFFTFFGWTGVMMLNTGASVWAALAAAGISGSLAMVLVGYMMYKFSQFDESGTFNTNAALNNVGEVYLVIPASKTGYGKIHLKIKGALKEMDAVTDDTTAIPTGKKVKVIEVLDDNLLLVQPWKK